MSDWKYDVDDLVWAKMKGFPSWPGRVSEPTKMPINVVKENSRRIFFFGSGNIAWIGTGHLKPYLEFKDILTNYCKTEPFKCACKAIEQYILDNKYSNNNRISGTESRCENLVNNETPTQVLPIKKTISNDASLSTPNVTVKRCSKPVVSTVDKPKKIRLDEFSSNPPTDIGLTNNHLSPIRENNIFLDRPKVTVPKSSILDVTKISKSLLSKNKSPSNLTFGFIGLGNIGSENVKNLLNSGHKVIIWNRTTEKCNRFEEVGATVGLTPSNVVRGADIIFSCVSDPQVAENMVLGNCGVLTEIGPGKGYVQMSSVDPETSIDIGKAIVGRGGRFLEAMIQGCKTETEERNVVCMTAGDKSLFDDCRSMFCTVAKNSIYLGEVGSAVKMNLILHLIKAVMLAGLAEGMALAERAGVPQRNMMDVLGMTSLNCPLLINKGKAMMDNNFKTNQALKLLQKDLSLSLNWTDTLEHPCPVTATVNEAFKHVKRLGYGDHDTSVVYIRSKF